MCLYLFAFLPSNLRQAKELIFGLFMTCFAFSVLDISGSNFLSLPLLQAIPLPLAWKEDPSALGKYHQCAQTDPLLGDHSEWAGPTWRLPRLSSDSHPQSKDHRPGPGRWPQEHTGSQVRICFHPQSKVIFFKCIFILFWINSSKTIQFEDLKYCKRKYLIWKSCSFEVACINWVQRISKSLLKCTYYTINTL